ncbi:hypothetical protein [Glycomyces arizonensis]|uniref:hypothetical protein n=1 Tax=Glycomyces arizonensis TaxID=256035 RepID=UPI0012EBCBA3|nr:hypothetical protein [Glycomyces arizonensis]
MPSMETETIKALSAEIARDVVPVLEEANAILPEVRKLDAMLMVSVDPSLAAAHALASGYMIEMVQGTAECLIDLTTNMDGAAKDMEDTDEAVASQFK